MSSTGIRKRTYSMPWQMMLPLDLVQLSRYTFTDTQRGFMISSNERPTIRVELEEYAIVVTSIVTPRQLGYTSLFEIDIEAADEGTGEIIARYSLFEYRHLLASIASALMSAWMPPIRADRSADIDPYRLDRLEKWAVKQTTRALQSRVYSQWRRLLELAGPLPCAVHQRIFGVCYTTNARQRASTLPRLPLPEHKSQLYAHRHRFLVRDILQYRPAVIALRYWNLFGRTQEYLELNEDGYMANVHYEELLEQLEGWRGLYSPTGRTYSNLNKTLDQLPGGLSSRSLPRLQTIMLERPVRDRLELALLLEAIGASHDFAPLNLHMFMYAQRGQIVEALRCAEGYLQQPLNLKRTGDIVSFAQLLNDYPEEHRGGLLSLTVKSIAWHRELNHTPMSIDLDPAALTPTPPVNLARYAEHGITYLDSVQAILDEGQAMQNCIATYAEAALRGATFLFHASYQGEEASLEVSPYGYVKQAFGPRNVRNKASEYGKRVLTALAWR
jgi:PcfJ-like protein